MDVTNVSNKLLQCPISSVLLHDPVIAQDGHTYERSAIEDWIQRNGTSPITKQPLSIQHIYPNLLVKQIIESFEALTRNKKYEFILNVDLAIVGQPFFRTYSKAIYKGKWLISNEKLPEIALLRINGVRAKKEASFYVDLSRHPHIVRTFGFVNDKSRNEEDHTVLLVQELACQGSLYDLFQDRSDTINKKVLVQIFLQIVEAMIYLASNNIVHGDLACRNVLVFRFDPNIPEKNIVKITDFGLSRSSPLFSIVPSNASTQLDIVPIRYAAPEILLDSTRPDNYTEKSDIYSMGVLMWEAYSRSIMPWNHVEKNEDVIQRVISGELLSQPSDCSLPYWNIILKTWAKMPHDRPTFMDLKHLIAEQYYQSDCCQDNDIPKWRRTMPGICLEGPCTNKSCKAYNQGYVIICIGMKKFDLFLDSDESTSKCPICSSYVDPKDVGFINCQWHWSGIQQLPNRPPTRCKGEWKVAINEYQRLGANKNENISWRQLILEAISL